jgi:hypothetical protein
LRGAIEKEQPTRHEMYRSVFLLKEAKANLEEAELILAIDEAELAYMKLKEEDTTTQEGIIKTTQDEIVKFKAEVKKHESNVRKLKSNVRMIVIWSVVIVVIFGGLGWGCYYVNKNDEQLKEDPDKFE